MATVTKYTYSCANVAATNELLLIQEIQASSIVTSLTSTEIASTTCNIWFKDVLSDADKTTLDAVVAAHVWTTMFAPVIPPQMVSLDVPKTLDGRQRVAMEKPSGTRATQVTFDFCDKTVWYPDSLRVVGETPTEPDSVAYYQLAYPFVIDTYHGKVMGEDFLKDADGYTYRIAVTRNGVAVAEQNPHLGSGGDYTVDYVNGRITPLSWSRGDGTILVTYHYARTSKFWIKPAAGQRLSINAVEAQFAIDLVMTDTAVLQPRGLASAWAPQLGLPAGTKIPLGNPLKYKSIRNFLDDSNKSYPSYPALGGSGWRGLTVASTVFDWDYTTTTDLLSSTGMEIQMSLEHDVPFIGTFATITFYCSSVPE